MRRLLIICVLTSLCVVAVWYGNKSSSQPTANRGNTGKAALTPEAVPPEVAALLERGENKQALAALDRLIEQRPQVAGLYSVRATIKHRQGEAESALDDLDRAISLSPQDARLYNNRGFMRLGLSQHKEAAVDFDRATEIDPSYANAYNNRGLLLIARGKMAESIVQFDQAIKLDPKYVDALNNRGFAAMQIERVEEALTDFNAAIAVNSKYVNAYNNRGLLRARAGDLEGAVLDFTEAMMLDPYNPKYYQHRREVYLRQSAFDLAVADERKHDWLQKLRLLTAAISQNPESPIAYLDRAKHFLAVDNDEKAAKDVERALKIDARCAKALVVRANLRMKWSEYQGALDDSLAALAIEPSHEALCIKGDAYLSLKDYDHAIESFVEAQRIDSSVAEAYFHKSRIQQAAGEKDAAHESLRQAVALDPEIEHRLR